MVIMVKKVTVLNVVIMVYNVKAYSNTTREPMHTEQVQDHVERK